MLGQEGAGMIYHNDPLERFAADLWEVMELEPPIDVMLIAERFGVVLERDYLGLKVSGLCWVGSAGTRYAITNKLEPLTRQRFVGLHEIAHHIFDKPSEGILLMDTANTIPTDPCEIKADKFAATVLMPESLVRRYWDEFKSNPECRIEILADIFNVSLKAMKFRLRELNICYYQRI